MNQQMTQGIWETWKHLLVAIGIAAIHGGLANSQESNLSELHRARYDEPILSIRFLGTDKVAVACKWERVRVIDIKAKSESWSFVTGKSEFAPEIACSRDGERIFVGSPSGTVQCWDLRKKKSIWVRDLEEPCYGISLSGDEKLLLETSDKRIRLIKAVDGTIVKSVDRKLPAWDSYLSPDSRYVLVRGRTLMELRRVPSLELETNIDLSSGQTDRRIFHACWMSDQSKVAILAEKGVVHLFNIKEKMIESVTITDADLCDSAFTHSGDLLVGTIKGDLLQWDFSAKRLCLSQRIVTDEITGVAISFDEEKVAVASVDGSIVVLNWKQTGKSRK